MNILEIKSLSKKYGDECIFNNVNAVFDGRQIYGITGENGAGKTVFFRTLSGLAEATGGSILYNGEPLKNANINIGLLTDDISFYPEFSGAKNLMLLASIRKKIGKAEVGDTMERVGLNPSDKRLFYKYSLGMKQRLALAQAIMEKPDFLFLDEPTNSIDEVGVNMFYQIVKEEASRGAVVLISSHIKSDINTLANKVYVFDNGTLVERK